MRVSPGPCRILLTASTPSAVRFHRNIQNQYDPYGLLKRRAAGENCVSLPVRLGIQSVELIFWDVPAARVGVAESLENFVERNSMDRSGRVSFCFLMVQRMAPIMRSWEALKVSVVIPYPNTIEACGATADI